MTQWGESAGPAGAPVSGGGSIPPAGTWPASGNDAARFPQAPPGPPSVGFDELSWWIDAALGSGREPRHIAAELNAATTVRLPGTTKWNARIVRKVAAREAPSAGQCLGFGVVALIVGGPLGCIGLLAVIGAFLEGSRAKRQMEFSGYLLDGSGKVTAGRILAVISIVVGVILFGVIRAAGNS